MNTNPLPLNWITEGLIDFEYKQYVFMAYLQNVRSSFEERKIYPFFANLLFHHKNLLSLQTSKQKVRGQQLQKAGVLHSVIKENELLAKNTIGAGEIEQILDFAIPHVEDLLVKGKSLYHQVVKQLQISTVGQTPTSLHMGYLITQNGNNPIEVFKYKLKSFTNHSAEQLHSIKVAHVVTYPKNNVASLTKIKKDLALKTANRKKIAIFLVRSSQTFPMYETFMPVAKRALIDYIT